LEVVPRVLLLTSMSKTNPVSLWSTARPPLCVEVVGLLEAGRWVAVDQHTTVVVRGQAVLTEEAPNTEVEVNEGAQEEGGGIGIR